jgi:hypothetical protein
MIGFAQNLRSRRADFRWLLVTFVPFDGTDLLVTVTILSQISTRDERWADGRH